MTKALDRTLNLPQLIEKKSFFLFGPRATGKSTLIRNQFSKDVPYFDLLQSSLYLKLSAQPDELEPMIKAHPDHRLVIIDEIQRVPMLLNEVHRLIENDHITFLLTGSSARKLKHHHANLLAGRAWKAELFPLTWREISNFNLKRYLQFGGLPAVYLSEYPREELDAYVDTYLKEEIQAESLIRKIPAFSRFLQFSALTSGHILNFTELASDSHVPVSTVREYYHLLEDTFIGFMLPPWQKTTKRKAVSTAKFYFFDLGVRNILSGIHHIEEKSDQYGLAFEHFITLEVRAYLSYRRKKLNMHFWRSKHGAEADLIIGDKIAIEIKSTKKVDNKHLKGLNILAEEKLCERYLLISRDEIKRKYTSVEALHWKDFLEQLWNDEII